MNNPCRFDSCPRHHNHLRAPGAGPVFFGPSRPPFRKTLHPHSTTSPETVKGKGSSDLTRGQAASARRSRFPPISNVAGAACLPLQIAPDRRTTGAASRPCHTVTFPPDIECGRGSLSAPANRGGSADHRGGKPPVPHGHVSPRYRMWQGQLVCPCKSRRIGGPQGRQAAPATCRTSPTGCYALPRDGAGINRRRVPRAHWLKRGGPHCRYRFCGGASAEAMLTGRSHRL